MKARKSVPIGRLGLVLVAILAAVVVGVWGFVTISYADGAPTAPYDLEIGYLDHAFGDGVFTDHTATRPESKLWWNDGYWWATLWNPTTLAFHIYRLDWGNQEWQDTGVAIDNRINARTDTLWDEATGKLYISSYPKKDNPSRTGNALNRARLYRYSYDEALETYQLDPGFYVNINEDETNSAVIAKDGTGKLWTTYVSRRPQPPADNRYQVYVNSTNGDDLTWNTPVSLLADVGLEQAQVLTDDLSTVFSLNGTVGVMWTNQLSSTLNFALYNNSFPMDSPSAWTHQVVSLTADIDDHLSVKVNSAGQVFAAIKTTAEISDTNEALIAMVARDAGGTFTDEILVSLAQYNDTRPTLAIDEGTNEVYIFMSGKPGGSHICYRTATITPDLNNMNFNGPADCGTEFIKDATYANMDSVTAFKAPANSLTTGLVALAADDHNGKVYVHNVIGNPPPVLTHRSPAPGQLDAPVDSAIRFTFSHEMDEASVENVANFTLEDSTGPVAGGPVVYDSATRTAVFTPTAVLEASTIYTVTVRDGMQSSGTVPLFETETWSFSTGAPFVSFEVGEYSVVENEGPAVVTVTLSSPASAPVEINYATVAGGTATEGVDYTAVADVLTFAPGEFSKNFTVPITDDAMNDGANETVFLELNTPVNAVLTEPSTATLTIVDDDGDPTLQFLPSSINVDEGAGTAEVTVRLIPMSPNQVTVNYTTIDGGATAGEDYTAQAGMLTFAPGEGTKTINVPITDDDVDEPNETVNLQLSNPTGGAVIGSPGGTATVTIVDNDATPAVRFAQASYTVNESAGTATINVSLSGATEHPGASVDYATGTGTAVGDTDYGITSGTLTFGPGEVSKSFTVPIANDNLHEATEFVNLVLSAPNNLTLGTPSQAQLMIQDNDPQPTVRFAQSSMSVDEDGGSAAITVVLSGVSGRTTRVDYATGGGSATSGADYGATSGTLEITPGTTSDTITVPITDDALLEGTETVVVTLSAPEGAALGSPSTFTLRITDDEGAILRLPIVFNP